MGWCTGLDADPAGGRPLGQVDIGGERNAVGSASLPLNAWSHLAVTFDGCVVRLFVNGVQAGSLPFLGSMAASTGPLRLGGNGVWGEWFAGLIDEVRVYSRALSCERDPAGHADTRRRFGAAATPADTTAPSAPSGLSASSVVGSRSAGRRRPTPSASRATTCTARRPPASRRAGQPGRPAHRHESHRPRPRRRHLLLPRHGRGRGRQRQRTVSRRIAIVPSAPPPPPPASGLVAAYRAECGFGSSVVDSSGRGNGGRVSGAVWSAAGRFGSALSFDGVNDWVTVADSARLICRRG